MNTIWKTALIAGIFSLASTASAATGRAAPASTEVTAVLTDTTIFGIPAAELPPGPGNVIGTNWESGDVWHARKLPVFDVMRDGDGQQIGSLERTVSFDWRHPTSAGEVESTAHCSYTMELDGFGKFVGHCAGDLLHGIVLGGGAAGHQRGIYALVDGGVPGIGPYRLEVTITG